MGKRVQFVVACIENMYAPHMNKHEPVVMLHTVSGRTWYETEKKAQKLKGYISMAELNTDSMGRHTVFTNCTKTLTIKMLEPH